MAETEQLIEGFRRFRRRYFSGERSVYERLNEGQTPSTLVVACCDSRVDPAIIFEADPGDLFVVRNVANLIPPYERDHGTHGVSAALEFGVCVLGVRAVIVLGHARCGGIRALLDGAGGEFLPQWMAVAAPARDRVLAAGEALDADARERACELAAMRISLDHLREFPWIASRTAAGSLELHGWYFDLERGELLRLGDRDEVEVLSAGDGIHA